MAKLDTKLKKNESEFDRSNFYYKETVYALQHLYVKLLYKKTRFDRFLRALPYAYSALVLPLTEY